MKTDDYFTILNCSLKNYEDETTKELTILFNYTAENFYRVTHLKLSIY